MGQLLLLIASNSTSSKKLPGWRTAVSNNDCLAAPVGGTLAWLQLAGIRDYVWPGAAGGWGYVVMGRVSWLCWLCSNQAGASEGSNVLCRLLGHRYMELPVANLENLESRRHPMLELW